MAYLTGNTITAVDYNALAAQVNAIIDTKYGQTPIATVAASAVVSASQWATLLNGITTASNVQGSSIASISNPVSTNTIAHLTDLEANIAVIEVAGAAGDAAAVGTPITAGGSIDRTADWNDAISVPTTVTFGTVAEMTNFFNAGGILKLTFSRSGGAASAKNTGWTDLCTACGTIALTGAAASKTIAAVAYTGTTKIGGSGSPTTLLTGTGAFALTGSDAEIFKQFDASANYTSNAITVNAKVVGSVITLTVLFQDDANVDSDEIVDGTLNTTLTATPPDTTYISNSWGTPTLGGSQTGGLNATVAAGSFVTGITYTIVTAGTTDFTLIGSADSVPGTIFVATGAGTGTGTADLTTGITTLADDLLAGTPYIVSVVGTSDFTLVGAASNTVGQAFTPTGNLVSAGAFVVGKEYQVTVAGNTDFNAIGATVTGLPIIYGVGTQFTATGVGSGTGTATETGSIAGTGEAIVSS